MDAVAQAITNCRELTANMLDAAQRGDWTAVTALDAERRPCFDGLEVAAMPLEALDAALVEFRALMAMDGRLRELAADARQAALGAVREARGRRQGRARYHELAVRG